jgi:nucleotide-binding universal stress UspA family protein
MKILLPVDGSDYTERMLVRLADLKELLVGDHEYTLFTVIEPSTLKGAYGDCGSLEQVVCDRAEQVLQSARAFAQKQKWNFRTDYVPGAPVQSIVSKVESFKPDLIVMGTRGRSPLGTFVLGSVANGVLCNCSVPLLLIR